MHILKRSVNRLWATGCQKVKGADKSVVNLLTEPKYVAFLAQTHPELKLSSERFNAPTYLAALQIDEALISFALQKGVAGVGRILPRVQKPHGFFVGTPFERYEQTHLLLELAPENIAPELKRLGGYEDADVVVLTNVCPRQAEMGKWLRAGFVALPSFPDMVIEFDENSTWDAHLGRLDPRARESIRRNIRSFERAGHYLERVADTAQVSEVLHGAYQHFYQRARVKWQMHSEPYFAKLAALDNRVRVTVAKSERHEVIGFIVNFVEEQSWQAGRIGVVPAYFQRDAIYFRLLYHALQDAIKHRARALSFEPTGYRVKRRLGATYKPLVNLVLGVSPLWRMLLATSSRLAQHSLRHLRDPQLLEAHY